MTNSEARKRNQAAQAPQQPHQQPNRPGVDSGAIGRLTEAERANLREHIAEAIFADEYGAFDLDAHPDHNRWTWQGDGHSAEWKDNWRRMADCALTVVEPALTAHITAALAEVEALLTARTPPSEPATEDEDPFVSGYCENGACDRCAQGPEFNLDGNMLAEECAHSCHSADPTPAPVADRDAGLSEDEWADIERILRWHFDVVAQEGKGSTYATVGISNAIRRFERILAARAQPEGTERVEWGVIEDRTEDGLGRLLVAIRANEDLARRAAREAHSERGYPVAVKRRAVTFGEWTEVDGDE